MMVLPHTNHPTLMTIVGLVACPLCFSVMFACVLWGVVINLRRVDRVNERLPAEQQFAVLGWWPAKRARFEREYERLFPDRSLRRKERMLLLFGALALIGFVLSIGAFF
jgi:hypothetical protein